MEPLEDADPRRVGRFELVARLGSGGMGRVYLARTSSGEQFALKMIHQHVSEDAQFRRRFQREVVAARRVTGPNTAALVDADPDGRPPWMATEFVDGPTLSELIERGGPLTPASCLRLAGGMAQALLSIHAAGLVHRDLKPSNVLMGADGASLIDFGIAQSSDASSVLTMTGLVTGSAGFMSPEQAQAEHVTEASDVFALGAVLFYAATGKRAFGEGSLISVTYRVVHADPSLGGIRDEGLRALIADCLLKDPDSRPTPGQILARCPGILDGTWRAGRPVDPEPALALVGLHDGTGQRLRAPAQWGGPPPANTESMDLSPSPPADGDGAGPNDGWFADLRRRAPQAWLVLPAAGVLLVAGAVALLLTKGHGSGQADDGTTIKPQSVSTAVATTSLPGAVIDPSGDATPSGTLPTSTYYVGAPTGRSGGILTSPPLATNPHTSRPTVSISTTATGRPKPPVTATKPPVTATKPPVSSSSSAPATTTDPGDPVETATAPAGLP